MSEDTTSRIDETLGDYTRQHQPGYSADMEGLNNIMAEAKQIMDAALIARFTEEQAFQFARDYFNSIHAAALAAVQS